MNIKLKVNTCKSNNSINTFFFQTETQWRNSLSKESKTHCEMKWLNPLHHFSGCSKVGGGFLKKNTKFWGLKFECSLKLSHALSTKNTTSSTKEKITIEKVMLILHTWKDAQMVKTCPLQMPAEFSLLLLIHWQFSSFHVLLLLCQYLWSW